MIRGLGWIAIGGLGIGAACLSLAFAVGGHDLDDLLLRTAFGPSCGDGAKIDAHQRERRLPWDGSDSVELSLPGLVHFRGGQGSDMIVRGSPDLIAHVEVRQGRITLNCRSDRRTRDLEVTLPGRPFRRIGVAGSGRLVMENVEQPDLALAISGSGTIRAQGSVDRATVEVSGSGNAKLGELAVKQLTVDISGSGKVEASPNDAADIGISGSGDVRLLTHPASLRSKVSGSGRVTQASLDPATAKDRR